MELSVTDWARSAAHKTAPARNRGIPEYVSPANHKVEKENVMGTDPNLDIGGTPVQGTPGVVIDGREHTLEEVQEWYKDHSNKAEWQRAQTQRDQAISEEKRRLEYERQQMQGFPATQPGYASAPTFDLETIDPEYRTAMDVIATQKAQAIFNDNMRQVFEMNLMASKQRLGLENPHLSEAEQDAIILETARLPGAHPFAPLDYRPVLEKRNAASQSEAQRIAETIIQQRVAEELARHGIAPTIPPSTTTAPPLLTGRPVPASVGPPGGPAPGIDWKVAEAARLAAEHGA